VVSDDVEPAGLGAGPAPGPGQDGTIPVAVPFANDAHEVYPKP